MSQAAVSGDPTVDVWTPTRAEWGDYVRARLEALGVTYAELARQARDRDFQSTEAMHTWILIGDAEA